MSERWVVKQDLGVTRLLWLFAVLSVVFLGVLAVAPARSHFTEWRAAQLRYGALAAAQGKEGVEPGIQQIWNPRLGVVDRCTSCHVGMSPAGPVVGDRLFAKHPPIPHDPESFGCVLCHGGQGRGTTLEAAHGLTRHWDEPILDPRDVEAGCGSCHTHLPVPSEEASRRGEALFRRYDCLACHRMEGAGRGTAADLTYVGMTGLDRGWYAAHDARAREASGTDAARWRASWGAVPDDERTLVEGYLATRMGAPRLLEAKALAHRLGCRGCHKINGVGGDDGPDLSSVGRKVAADLDYSGVRGAHTLPSWLREHFLDPARVTRGSLMPDLSLSEAEADELTLYMLSLRALDVPEAFWPKDKIRGARLGEREFATDGESLFGVFCAGCHGAKGAGRRYGNAGVVFPAIGNADFLAIATDAYLKSTVTHGRPGRRMPAWGEKDGGLRGAEIDAIVGYLRSLAPGTPESYGMALPAGDPALGAPLFARNCSGCHGAKGEGREAPGIANPAFLASATDDYIAAAILRGRAGTSMRHFGRPMTGFATLEKDEVAHIVAYIRSLGAAPKGSS